MKNGVIAIVKHICKHLCTLRLMASFTSHYMKEIMYETLASSSSVSLYYRMLTVSSTNNKDGSESCLDVVLICD